VGESAVSVAEELGRRAADGWLSSTYSHTTFTRIGGSRVRESAGERLALTSAATVFDVIPLTSN
jgi:hypothetical protein